MLDAAQETPQGRARIALVAALGDLPGWAGAGTPRPSGPAAREAADHTVLRDQLVDLMVSGRAELIQRAGGNPASTSGAARFRDALRQDDVARLYAAAGLDLTVDLARLDAAPPVTADPAARAYVARFSTPTGDLHGRPVLTLHTTGDGLAVPSHESAYAAVVHDGELSPRRSSSGPGTASSARASWWPRSRSWPTASTPDGRDPPTRRRSRRGPARWGPS